MNNCLVTKLKGTVSNENLPKLGEININLSETDILSDNNGYILIQYTDNGYSILNGGTEYKIGNFIMSESYAPAMTNGSWINVEYDQKIDIPSNKCIIIRSADHEQLDNINLISSKYNCISLTSFATSINKDVIFDIIKYSPNFKNLSLRRINIDISIEELVDLYNNFDDISYINIESTGQISGDITKLASFKNATWITFNGLHGSVDGTYEDLFVALYNNGVVDRNLFEIQVNSTTFNNISRWKLFATFSSTGVVVYDTNKSTILGTWNSQSGWSY